jgi:hypothetical protein
MKTTIGIYETHKKALKAVKELMESGFPVNKLSLIGKAEIIDDEIKVRPNEIVEEAPVSIGIVLGPVLGVLTGVGLFAIPGFGFLFGAGALVGAFAGFDLGLVGGGTISLLTTLGMKRAYAIKYHEHLKQNRFMVIAQGEKDEVQKAKEILDGYGNQMDLKCH